MTACEETVGPKPRERERRKGNGQRAKGKGQRGKKPRGRVNFTVMRTTSNSVCEDMNLGDYALA